MEWVWQGLLTNWLAAAGIGIGALIVAYLKKNHPEWAAVALYGLSALSLLTVSLWAFKSISILPKEIPQVTPNNVEEHIGKWLDRYELGRRKTSHPDTYFTYEITLRNGTPIILTRPKSEHGDYINLQAGLEVTPEQKAVLARVKSGQRDQLLHEFYLEMARTRVNGWLVPPDKIEKIVLSRRFPITSSLTEESFIGRIDEISFAMNIVHATIVVTVDRLQEKNAPQ